MNCMTSELSGFVADKRGKGYPWAHIAAMAGRPLDTFRPFMEMEREAKARPAPAEEAEPAQKPVARRKRGIESCRARVLLALAAGFGTVKAIRAHTKINGNSVCARLIDIRAAGHAVMVTERENGKPATYAITSKGLEEAQRLTGSAK